MDHVYKNTEEYNPNKKRKKLIVFDDVIAKICLVKKHNPVVTALFTRGRKISISLVFITQSCFVVPKNIRLIFTTCFSMILPNKREFNKLHLIINQISTSNTL